MLNARSLAKPGAIDTLLLYLVSNQMDVAMITESWLSENISSNELSLKGHFNIFRKDRNSHGGGVLILVNSIYPCAEVLFPSANSSSEIVSVDLCFQDSNIRLVCPYFSPTGSADALRQRMFELVVNLEHAIEVNHTVVIAGDMNLPLVNWRNWSCPASGTSTEDLESDQSISAISKEVIFLNFCSTSGLKQLVEKPTRLASDNILDVVLCNDDSVEIMNVFCPPIKSDHSAICFEVQKLKYEESRSDQIVYDYKRGDYDSIVVSLFCTNWWKFFHKCVDAHEMYERLLEYLYFLRELNVPQRNCSSKRQIDKHIERLMKEIETSTTSCYSEKLQSRLSKAVRRQRILRESQVVSSENPAAIHKYVAERMSSRDSLAAIKRPDGSMATDDIEKSEILKDVFSETYPSVGDLIARRANRGPIFPDLGNINMIENVDSSPETLFRHLKKLKNTTSSTPDNLPACFFKSCGFSICLPLSIIFRKSLESGRIPRMFRKAIICPVHKKGSKTEASNKRPVSMTSIPCKIMESVICEAIYRNANEQNLISREQFAYRPGLSTELQLLECQNDWMLWLNRSVPFDVIYYDFKSAFESVTHEKLLRILPFYGIGDRVLNWIRSFLSERTFRVRVNDSLSSCARVSSGCPQGTILGPLMYILYTDSLKYIIPRSVRVKIYADDIKMYSVVNDEVGARQLQSAVDSFFKWTESLDLKLSVNKCAVVHFGNRNMRTKYTLADNPLPEVEVIRDLGVLTSAHLKYCEQTADVVSRVSRRCAWLLRSFVLKEASLYIRLFKIYILPIISYASPVWRPGLKKDQALLQKAINKFLRRVAYRCNISKDEIVCDILQTFDNNDQKAFIKICNDTVREKQFFSVTQTNTRRGVLRHAKDIALKKTTSDTFAWRLTKTN